MSKLHVLMGGCIDDRHVIGVFTSIKRAEEVRQHLIKTTYYGQFPEELTIDSYRANESYYLRDPE